MAVAGQGHHLRPIGASTRRQGEVLVDEPMDARTNIKSRLPSRRAPAGGDRAPHHSADWVVGLTTSHMPGPVVPGPVVSFAERFKDTEIFKKTPCIADSKFGGRDVAKDVFDLGGEVSDADLVERRNSFRPRVTRYRSGAIWTHAQQAGRAVNGAVTHRGGAQEKQCYADI